MEAYPVRRQILTLYSNALPHLRDAWRRYKDEPGKHMARIVTYKNCLLHRGLQWAAEDLLGLSRPGQHNTPPHLQAAPLQS